MKNFVPSLLFSLCSFLSLSAQALATETLPVDPTTNCVLRYYYFPNMEAYYDIKNNVYHYQKDKNWVVSTELPTYYGGYSLFKNERVYITDYEGDTPEQFIKKHRKAFPFNPKGRIKRPIQAEPEVATALIQ